MRTTHKTQRTLTLIFSMLPGRPPEPWDPRGGPVTLERLRMSPADSFGDAWKRIAFEENELACERNRIIPSADFHDLERRTAVVLGNSLHAGFARMLLASSPRGMSLKTLASHMLPAMVSVHWPALGDHTDMDVRVSTLHDEIILEPVHANYKATGRSFSRKLADFGLTGGMAKLHAEEMAPLDPPRAFKKGSFFPPESVAKSRNKLNKPPRGRRR